MSNYYCLVTGLPDLSMEEGKLAYSVANFKEEIYPHLSSSDKKLIDLYYLKYDNLNLLKLIADKDCVELDSRGNYTAEQLSALIESVKDGDKPDKSIPSYFQSFLSDHLQKVEENGYRAEDALAACYYAYAMQCSNSFISRWFEFNLNVNNLLAAQTARKYKLDVASTIVGDTEICESIRTSTSRDFGLTGVIDYLEEVQHIADTDNLVEKERKIDGLKWNWLEEESFFNYFSVEKLFVFLQRIELIERWNLLDKDKGCEMFRDLIQKLKGEVRIPEEL